jgi:hypothetical protein
MRRPSSSYIEPNPQGGPRLPEACKCDTPINDDGVCVKCGRSLFPEAKSDRIRKPSRII